eukprot:UN10545
MMTDYDENNNNNNTIMHDLPDHNMTNNPHIHHKFDDTYNDQLEQNITQQKLIISQLNELYTLAFSQHHMDQSKSSQQPYDFSEPPPHVVLFPKAT